MQRDDGQLAVDGDRHRKQSSESPASGFASAENRPCFQCARLDRGRNDHLESPVTPSDVQSVVHFEQN